MYREKTEQHKIKSRRKKAEEVQVTHDSESELERLGQAIDVIDSLKKTRKTTDIGTLF